MDKIPIPDGWKQDYPHFIADPRNLRLGYLAILIVTGIVFVGSCVYYYADPDIIGEISFYAQTGEGWECESIGTFNGEFVFPDFDKLSVNLSQSVSIGYVFDVFPYVKGEAENGYVTGSIPTSSSLSYNVSSYQLADQALEGKIDAYTSAITWGAAPTIDECLDMMEERSCNTIHNPLNDASVYKFTFAISTISSTSVTMDDVGAFGQGIGVLLFDDGFQTRQSVFQTQADDWGQYSPFFSYGSESEYFVVTSNDIDINLCDVISDGMNNKKLFWGMKVFNDDLWINNENYTCQWQGQTSHPITQAIHDICDFNNGSGSSNGVEGFDFSHECELISNDYCIVNASDQFVYTADDPLKTGTRITGKNYLGSSGNAQVLLLHPDLGTECVDRWSSVCKDNYDIAGYCDNVYSPPYSCTQIKRKSWWSIVSLAFASSQLATMVLVVCGGFLFSKFSDPTDKPKETDKREDNVREEIEMGEDKQTNVTVATNEAEVDHT